MKMPVIAIDIDDVLADHAKGFTKFSNERYGTKFNPDDYNEHWANIWGIDNIETEKRAREFYESGVLLTYDHVPTSLNVLKKLKKKYNLMIITSRSKQVQGDTIAWMNKYYNGLFRIEDIKFAGIWDDINDTSIHKTKGNIIKNFNAEYLIDDQIKHCISASELGIKALLFGDYSWNRCEVLPKGIKRVSNWQEVEDYFDEIK